MSYCHPHLAILPSCHSGQMFVQAESESEGWGEGQTRPRNNAGRKRALAAMAEGGGEAISSGMQEILDLLNKGDDEHGDDGHGHGHGHGHGGEEEEVEEEEVEDPTAAASSSSGGADVEGDTGLLPVYMVSALQNDGLPDLK